MGGFGWLNDGESTDLYGQLETGINTGAVTIYHLLAKIGVYASGLAILIAAILLIINANSGGEKLSDAKKYVVRVLIVSILIFAVSGLVLLVSDAGVSGTRWWW